jgi:hypothetical protein
MPIKKPVYQLQLELELEQGEAQEDALQLSDRARSALDAMRGKLGSPKWLDEYFALREGGWNWRVAVYIAWAASPRAGREPKTQDELARMYLGLTSDRVIATWRKRNPVIDEIIHSMQGVPLWKHRAEIITALVVSAVKPDYKNHNDRKLALELMGDHLPTHKLTASIGKRLMSDDLAELSDEELREIAAGLKNIGAEEGEDDSA